MSESVLNMFAQQYIDMILCKSRYDVGDIQWFTEGPFWLGHALNHRSRNQEVLQGI